MKWQTTKLEKLCSVITKGTTPRTLGQDYVAVGIPFLRAENLQGDEIIIGPGTLYIDDVTNKLLSRSVILPGDVLISIAGTIGRSAIVSQSSPAMNCNQAVAIVRLAGPLDGKFLLYWLKTRAAYQQISGAKVTQTISNLSLAQIKGLNVPLPTPSEQGRIVKILDQADALRKKRAEADAKADRILPALFYKMFGDPATNPKGWQVKPLSEITIGQPQYGANASAIEWMEGKPRYVRITDISADGNLRKTGVTTLDLDEWEPYRLVPGDLLFARSGNTVGKTYLYRKEAGLCAYAGYLIRFKPNKNFIEPWYLFAFTQTDHYRGWVEAHKRVAGQPNINGQEYASLHIPCPPIQLQQRFAHMLENVINNRRILFTAGEQMDYLFHVLLHRAFTGDLTAKWREAHMKELLLEMEEQSKFLI